VSYDPTLPWVSNRSMDGVLATDFFTHMEDIDEISKSLDIKHDLAELMRANCCDVGRTE
jgi:hypothetical protein